MALQFGVLLHFVARLAGIGHVVAEADQAVVPAEGIVSTGRWTAGVVTVRQQALQVRRGHTEGLGPVTLRVAGGPGSFIGVLLPDQISSIPTLPVNVGGMSHARAVALCQGHRLSLHAGRVRAHHV